MKLSTRFILDNLFFLAAAVLVVFSMAWSAGTAGWTAFGVSTGITVLAAASVAATRVTSRRIGHSLVALFGLWSLVAALAFSGAALTWLVFADAIAVGVLALADLAAHEASEERVVHQLDVRTHDERLAA
jgi:hypothetical protein